MLQDKDDDVRSAAVLALAKLLEGLEAEELGSVAAPLHRVYSSSKAEQSAATLAHHVAVGGAECDGPAHLLRFERQS